MLQAARAVPDVHRVHAGMLVSTCWVQLWWAGVTLSLILAALLHPGFWRLVAENKAWPISVIAIFVWHMVSQLALSRWVTPGTEIKRPLLWFFCYALLSTVYFTVRAVRNQEMLALVVQTGFWHRDASVQ